jgi:hypothetical protein
VAQAQFIVIRKHADRSGDPPASGVWPLAGVEVIEAPEVTRAWAEGFVTLENPRMVRRPGGPPHDLERVTHEFLQADAIVIHGRDGDVRYRVVHQPDKYVADGDDDTPMTPEHYAVGNSRVDWFYGLEREA